MRRTKKQEAELVRKVMRRAMLRVFADLIIEDPKLRELYREEIAELEARLAEHESKKRH